MLLNPCLKFLLLAWTSPPWTSSVCTKYLLANYHEGFAVIRLPSKSYLCWLHSCAATERLLIWVHIDRSWFQVFIWSPDRNFLYCLYSEVWWTCRIIIERKILLLNHSLPRNNNLFVTHKDIRIHSCIKWNVNKTTFRSVSGGLRGNLVSRLSGGIIYLSDRLIRSLSLSSYAS